MGRDWESQLYFPHVELTGVRLTALLMRLRAGGLAPTAATRDGTRFPAMSAISTADGRITIAEVDIETLLRTKAPPLGPGYGVITLRCDEPWAGPAGVEAFLSFPRPDPVSGLDAVLLTISGEAFHDALGRTAPAAFERSRDWFALLSEELGAIYGWGDWEDISYAVAPPTRPQALAGQVTHLFRLNCFGPALVERLGAGPLSIAGARWLCTGAAIVSAGMVYAERGTEERHAVATALGLRPAAGFLGL